MTPREFIFWLKGIDVGISGHPYEGTWKLIQEKLDEVKMEDGSSRIIPSIDLPVLDPPKVPPSPGIPPEIIC
jgi:hypothetical protein